MKDYPVIKFTSALIIGILLSKFISFNILILTAVTSAVIIIYMLVNKFGMKRQFLSAAVYLSLIVLGVYAAGSQSAGRYFLPGSIYKEKKVTAYGVIDEINLQNTHGLKFIITSDSLFIFNRKIVAKVRLLCRIYDNNPAALNSLYANLKPGYRIELKGNYNRGRGMRNPGEFDYAAYLRSKGLAGVLTSYRADGIKILDNSENDLKSVLFSVRKSIDRIIYRYHEIRTASLLRGLLLADRSEIDQETKTEFINSGVVHVLAVSGLHVGFIAVIFLFLFGRFNLYLKSLLTIAGLFTFLLITGSPPSVFRATVMAVVIIIAYLSGRSTNLFNSLALAAAIILLADPSELFNPGFQLSFAAVLSIAAVFPFFNSRISALRIKNKAIKWLLTFIGVSLSAQIGTLPLTLTYFGKLSIVALAANVVVIPLIGVIVGVAIVTLAFAPILPAIASYYAAANELFCGFLFKFVNYISSFDYSFISIKSYSAGDALIFYVFVILFFYFYGKLKHTSAKSALALLSLSCILLFSGFDDKPILPEGKLDVMMVDVGQGDSFIVKFPDGKTALIDAGSASYYFDNGKSVLLPLMDYLDIDKFDYGFVSHIDLDHYGGFMSLIREGKVKEIYKPKIDSSLKKDMRFENLIHKFKLPIRYYRKEIINEGAAKIYVMNDSVFDSQAGLSSNDRSGFFKIVYGKSSFLFTGDMEARAEKYYSQAYGGFLKSDVLKVDHHGSRSGSTEIFLSAVKPAFSLISAGLDNKFGHPAAIVIDRLRKIQSKIYRTDKSGAIVLSSGGNSVRFINWK